MSDWEDEKIIEDVSKFVHCFILKHLNSKSF